MEVARSVCFCLLPQYTLLGCNTHPYIVVAFEISTEEGGLRNGAAALESESDSDRVNGLWKWISMNSLN